MKKLMLLLLGTVLTCSVNAQKTFGTQQTSQESPQTLPLQATPVPVTYHGVTGNLKDYVEPAGTVNEITKTEKLGYSAKSDWGTNPNVNPNALPKNGDPIHQKQYVPPAPPTKSLNQNFDGMGYTGVNPADPSVDVGPNHVVQMINGSSGAYIQVFSKTGGNLMSPVYFDNFMGMAGGAGDPIVMYDERANRWFLSEFSQTGNNLHIAISQTADPTGAYYTYSFNSPGGFPDYPKYSIWENEYVMTANVNTPDIFAFNRADMLAGVATTAQMFSQSNFGTIGFQASTPVSLNGTTLPPAGQAALLMRMRDDAWAGSASDALEMWELDIDWVVPANSSLTQVQTIGVSAHETELCGYTSFSCIPQLGGTPLDPLRELLMNRIHYRNFGTHESIVCCHVTDVNGSDHAGIRWYELRRTTGAGGNWNVYQEGTYAPDTDHRWMPSIGISADGDIGLAYSVASTTTAPSLRYTGRKVCDPLNVMTEPETTIQAGTTANGSNRWGDYFQMGTDPSDGETFWFTGCYNVSSQWSTRVAAFTMGSCNPEVAFGTAGETVNEPDANQANGCLPYYIVNVPISIALDPSQPADVTVNVTGGTATNNVDYSIQNTSFTFDGATLSGTVVVWVYDDDYVEGTETIDLGYTLNANGGDAVAGSFNQTVTITINDDDLDPLSSLNPTPVVILTQDFETGLAPFTSQQLGGADPWQVGNEAAAASGNFPYPGTNTTQIAYVNDDACNCNMNNNRLNILPAVDLTNYAAATVTFDSYFFGLTYGTGTETLELEVNTGSGWTTVGPVINGNTGAADWVAQSFDVSAYVGNASVSFRIKYTDGGDWLYGAGVDNVVISGQVGIDIQQAVNTGSGMNSNLGPNETVHFYDATSGDVMMTLTNTSAFDYGCVDVEVDRAGTGAVQFNTVTPADYLTSKTFTVTPTNNNPAGTFDVTVYYKETEIAGWEAATGNSRNNAEVIKVAGNNAIQDVNPGNAGSFTIANSPATLGSFYSDVTFTAPFTTGFSGFGVGIYNPVAGLAPVANFSGTPTTICAGESVTFTDLSTNGPTGWSWTFGDGGTSTAQNPTYTYTTAGTYTVTLTASNGNGSDVFSITNYITVNAIPTVTASGTATICEGQSATISGAGATTYSWDNGLGAGATQSVSPTTTTTYTVTGTTAGCSNTDQVTITVTPLPTVVASGTATICEGQSTAITATGATTYSWDNGLGAGAAHTVSPTTTTTYTVTGTASGCTNTDQVTVTVTPLPTVVASGATTICEGQSATISGSGATTYSWDNGLGAGASQTVSPTTTTTYTVTGTTAGCTNTDQVTITVTPLPTVVASGTATICEGQSATISASGATTYSWDNGIGAGASHTVTPTTTTTYTVTGTTTGCTNTDQVTITVTPLPTVVASGTATICDGQSTTISATGATTYSWDQGLGAGASQTVSPTSTTTYTVTGTTAGCSSTDQVTVTVNPNPTVVASGATTICEGQSATISGSGATTYSWDNGLGAGASHTVSPTTTTTYTVTGTTAGCSSTDQVTITVTPLPTVVASGTATICDGQSTTISATGATTYSWDNGLGAGASHTVSPSTTTTYTVTGTTAGCTNTDQVTITVNPIPTVVASGAATICDGQSTAISATGATTYSWDNGLGAGASQTVSPTTTTTYTVTGTTAGCSSTDQVTITVTPLPNVVASGATTLCDGQSATISGSGATSYSWDNGLGAGASHIVTPSATTTYTVTGTTAGCSNTDAVTITVNPSPTITVMTANNPTTCGTTTGSIQIGGSGTGNIAWTGTASGSATGVTLPYTITGLAAGSYTIGFADGNGCTSNTLVQSLSDPAAPTVVASGTSTICDGQSVTISATGATTYSWDNGLGAGASHTVAPTTTTTYTVTGTLAGCTGSDAVTITVNPVPTVVATGTTTICEGASTTIDATGATTYSWDNGLGAGNSQTVSPTTTTTYTVTGTTAGCSNTDQVTVTVTPLPNVVATGTATICEGASTTLGATGASTYSWDNGLGAGASHTVSPTATTTYTVTGTTAGCTNTDAVTVTVNPLPSISVLAANNPTTCATSTGSIQIGGSGTGNVVWTGTASGSAIGVSLPYTITGLAAGSYTISYTDGNGCASNVLSQTLIDPSAPTVVATGTTTICEGQSVNINATGATTYSWDNGLGAGAAQTVSPTTTTTYTVTGTTAGCSGTDVVTITVNPLPTVVATGSASICEGQSANINATGATTYSWDQGIGAGAAQTVSPTATTTYTVTGTTAGCSSTDQVTITVNPVPTVVASGTTTICEGQSASISASGALSYNWDNGLGAGAAQTVSPTTTTTYTVTGTSAGCSSTDQVTITVTPGPSITATGTATICEGQSVTIDATGGTTYSWDNGIGAGATQVVSPTTTTTYTVTGTTAGCSGTDQVTITVTPLPTVVAAGTATICEGASTTIDATGATTYSWDNGIGAGANQTVSPTSTTTYTVTGTTAGCSNTDQITVTVTPLPTVVATGTATICEGASTTIDATGATTYSWDNGIGAGANQTVSPTTTTTYTVTGTASGCSNTDQVTITVTPLPTVVATGTATICEGGSTTIDATGATSFNWDNGLGAGATQTVSPTTTTTYTVTGTANGCSNTDQVTITVTPLPTVVATGTATICDGASASINATGADTYNWDNGVGAGASQTVSPSTTTTYTVTGTTTGCSNTDQVTITVTPLPTVVASGPTSMCEGESVVIDATGADSYDWDNGLGAGASHTVSPTTSTTYTVTGTTNGCSNTDQISINVNPLPTVSVSPSTLDTLCEYADPVALVGTPAGGTFSGNGITGSTFDPGAAGLGQHTITYDYTDGNSCSNSVTLTVTVDDCAGVDEFALTEVQLFPNPNTGSFVINGLEIGTIYKIYDNRGRLIIESVTTSDSQEVNMSDYENGLYYLRATKDGREGGIKFLIAR